MKVDLHVLSPPFHPLSLQMKSPPGSYYTREGVSMLDAPSIVPEGDSCGEGLSMPCRSRAVKGTYDIA